MKPHLFLDYKIKYARALPLSACSVTKPRLLSREGIDPDRGSVLLFLLPYYTSEGEGGDLSMYAAGRDYHGIFRRLSERLLSDLRRLMPDAAFAAYADHSPIDEKIAAAMAGLGVIGCHSLLINEDYSSFVFIGGIYSDIPVGDWLTIADGISIPDSLSVSYCSRCGACRRACPVSAIGDGDAPGDGFGIDPVLCLSAVSQKKTLTEEEEKLIAGAPFLWGCDVCQLACPHTAAARKKGTIYTPVEEFHENVIPSLTEEILDSLIESGEFESRAFSWRGEGVVRRNIKLRQKKDLTK